MKTPAGHRATEGTPLSVQRACKWTGVLTSVPKQRRLSYFKLVARSWSLGPRRRRTGSWWRNAKSELDMAIAIGKKNDLSLQQHLSGRKRRQSGCMEAVRVIRRSFQTNATPDTTSCTLQQTHPLRLQVAGSKEAGRTIEHCSFSISEQGEWLGGG